MGMTIDYGKLAAKSPKALGIRVHHPRPINDPGHRPDLIAVTPASKSTLEVPPGTTRYYLRVPYGREKQAIAAGCQFDQSIRRWYVDNPKYPADFANWKASRVVCNPGKASPA